VTCHTYDRYLKPFGRKFWSGICYVWDRPVIVVTILVVLSALLFDTIIKDSFKPYTNCRYLIATKLNVGNVVCDGVTVRDPLFGKKLFELPGLSALMDKPLELFRKVFAWIIVTFFVFLSLFLTITINNIIRIIKILTFNKEEWKRFLASARTFLLILVTFCSVFYFTAIR
jgi:hypothetical protein